MWWWISLVLLCGKTASGLCVAGNPGRDGTNCTVAVQGLNATCSRVVFNGNTNLDMCNGKDAPLPSVTAPASNCQSILWPGVAPLTICNQTVPVILLQNASTGCLSLTFGSQSRILCNGTQGASGQPGASGVAPSITSAGPGCVQITGSTSSVVICNATAPTLPPQWPNILVVDGTKYPLTRPGIMQALVDAYNPNGPGATILVAGDVVTDGIDIPQVDRVTLDFQGHQLLMPPGNTQVVVFGGHYGDSTAGVTLETFTVVGNISQWGSCFTVASVPTNVQWGQYATVVGYAVEAGAVGVAFNQYTYPTIITSVQGNQLCIHDGLPYYTFSNGPQAVMVYAIGCTDRFTLRNVVLNFNGNTANSAWAFAQYCNRCVWENIDIIGTAVSTAGGSNMLFLDHGFGNRFVNIRSINASVIGPGSPYGFLERDIDFGHQTHSYIENIESINFGGFAPALSYSHFCVWNGLMSVKAHMRGMRIDGSTRNTLTNLIINGALNAAGTGLRIAFGSQYNAITNLVTNGNADYGLAIDGAQGWDAMNTIVGFQGYNNGGENVVNCRTMGTGGDLIFGQQTFGNIVRGSTSCPVFHYNGGADRNQFISEFSNGLPHLSWGIQTYASPPAPADFVGMPGQMLFTLQDDSHLRVSVVGRLDGVIRSAVFALT